MLTDVTSFSGSTIANLRPEKIEPAIDIPVQFNFGSPYSSSLTIFFDFDSEQSSDIIRI